MPQSIDIIGTGNVAYHFARAIDKGPFELRKIHSRRKDTLQTFLEESHLDPHLVDDSGAPGDAQFTLLCVADDAIEAVLEKRSYEEHTVVIHCSGATDLSPFVNHNIQRYGVIYPYQTLTKGSLIPLRDVPLFIEASDEVTLERIRGLAQSISQKVQRTDSSKRLRLHLAAVFATNFTNAMYAIAEELLAEVDEDFQAVQHLVKAATQKAVDLGPKGAQTGPAVRRDVKTIEKHLKSLSDPSLKQIYRVISERISQA